MSDVKNRDDSANSNFPEALSQPTDGPDILDWDACIEVASVRPTRKIKVRLHDRGRDKPLPLGISHDEKDQHAS